LLLVHGRWSYRRVSLLILYSFWKNVLRTLCQFYFQIHNGWSGQTVYESWSIALWNTIFTAFPILFVATLDKDVSAKYSLNFPQLYTYGQKNKEFNVKRFSIWLLFAVYGSLVIFYSLYICFELSGGALHSAAYTFDIMDFGTMLFAFCVFICNLKIFLDIDLIHAFTAVSVFASILIYIIFLVFISSVALEKEESSATGVFERVMNSSFFWTMLILTIVLTLLPQYVYNSFIRQIAPESYQVVQEMKNVERSDQLKHRKSGKLSISRMSILKGERPLTFTHMGFSFSQSQSIIPGYWLQRILPKVLIGDKDEHTVALDEEKGKEHDYYCVEVQPSLN